MALIKITPQQILDWNGSDHDEIELAEYLAVILNREFDISDARGEILSYHNITRDED